MPLDLDRLQQRIVGVLAEKEMTVPESYPLTLNALVAGCNQKSNRDPHMEAEPYEVEGALHALMDRGWVVQVERAGGRASRYEHRAREQLGVDREDLAILSELLDRGAQTPGELKTRAGRMCPFASPTEIEARLRDLAARPVPYVHQLERRPREHAARWAHLLGDETTGEPEEAPPPEPVVEAALPTTPMPDAAASSDVTERIEALEREVGDLHDRLDRLEGR